MIWHYHIVLDFDIRVSFFQKNQWLFCNFFVFCIENFRMIA